MLEDSEEELSQRSNAQHYKKNGFFIGIDVFSFKTTAENMVPASQPRTMLGDDLKIITTELENSLRRPVMHTMPGNDSTCAVSPFKQWKQSGRGLAIPYQRDQGMPRTGIPNLWVSPIPSTFKKSENNSLGRQRYLISRYIRQLYYYAGLGFAIATPVRPTREGSEKTDSFGNYPNKFTHETSLSNTVLKKFDIANGCYEYAFGAGKYPDFCKHHGNFLEQELNQLESLLAVNNNSEQPVKTPAKNDYRQAFDAGLKQRKNFLKCLKQHEGINGSDADSIDQRFIIGAYIDQQFMQFYEPPIPENALINDPQLREQLEVLILQLEVENKTEADEFLDNGNKKVLKISALKALFEAEKEPNEKISAKQRCQLITQLIAEKVDYNNSTVRSGAFSRTGKLIAEIQEKYPDEPQKPDLKNNWWAPFDFTGLITTIVNWLYKREKAIYNEKINALTPTDLVIKGSEDEIRAVQPALVANTIYVPLVLSNVLQCGQAFFNSESARIQKVISAGGLQGYYSQQVADINASNKTASHEDTVAIMVLKKHDDGTFSGYVRDSKTSVQIGKVPINNKNNEEFLRAFAEVQARIARTFEHGQNYNSTNSFT